MPAETDAPIFERQSVRRDVTRGIEVKHVWKIFGPRAKDVMATVEKESLSKSEILERFGCGVGVVDASFSVAESEVFCIMGLSGSGKSTLVRLINRLIEPTAGQILVEGEDVMAANEDELRRLRAERIGMVFQNFALLPHRTVLENVAMPLEVKKMPRGQRREIARKALNLVGLSDWEYRYAHELSGGMQQRVGIARAMASSPAILLMDEPFSALDPLIRRQLQGEFIELSKTTKTTTIFITHDLEEAIRVGHRIAIMKDGVLVQTGTPEDIVFNPVDDYVADFVSGISKVRLLTAGRIMVPVAEYERRHGDLILEKAGRARTSDDLSTVIDVEIEKDGPILVESEGGKVEGVVGKVELLRVLKGGGHSERSTGAVRHWPVYTGETPDDDRPVEQYALVHGGYYDTQFKKLNQAVHFGWTFNWAAAMFGPIWMAARRLYPLFWIFLLLEATAIVQIGSGALGNLGGD
jgi:glycine betaine/proline transport system ATP-binding protein